MKILAIETSCDETAVCILECSGPAEKPEVKILANSLFSQVDIHKDFGGVVPHLAKREHIKNLPVLLEKTLKGAGYEMTNEKGLMPHDLDYIAVTVGPGLEPALWTGVLFAEELGKSWSLPVMGVNHMEGHIVSVLYELKNALTFPAIALLVSGGHTELVYIKSLGDYKVIGRTRDDAVGEAFDKVARLLGLPYPGGPQISRLAEEYRSAHSTPGIIFPRPMINSPDLDFSYSGLKTAVLYKIKDLGELTEEKKGEIACAFEDAAIDVLILKSRKAIEEYSAETFILGGGVAANKYLRQKVEGLKNEFPHLSILIPNMSLSTDNAVMIGMAAYINILNGVRASTDFKARGNLILGQSY